MESLTRKKSLDFRVIQGQEDDATLTLSHLFNKVTGGRGGSKAIIILGWCRNFTSTLFPYCLNISEPRRCIFFLFPTVLVQCVSRQHRKIAQGTRQLPQIMIRGFQYLCALFSYKKIQYFLAYNPPNTRRIFRANARVNVTRKFWYANWLHGTALQ